MKLCRLRQLSAGRPMNDIMLRLMGVSMTVVLWGGCHAQHPTETSADVDSAVRTEQVVEDQSRRLHRLLSEKTLFAFPGNSLTEIASMISGYYKIEVTVESEIQGLEVEVDCQGTLRECLDQLAAAGDIRWTSSEKGIKLLPKPAT